MPVPEVLAARLSVPAIAAPMFLASGPDLVVEVCRSGLVSAGRAVRFDDAMNIQFTSGTTGSPKGVTLTYHGTLNNGYFSASAWH